MNPLTQLLEAEWAERVGWTLLHSIWQIALLAAVYAIGAVLLRGRSASVRYIVGCVTLVAMLGFPLGTYLLLPENATPELTATDEPLAMEMPVIMPHVVPTAEVTVAKPLTTIEPPDLAAAETTLATPPVEPPGSITESLSKALRPWLPMTTAVWLLGTILFSLRPLWGLLHVRRLQRSGLSPPSENLLQTGTGLIDRLGITCAVRFALSTLVEVPTVVGYLRPIVLLPAAIVSGLSVPEVESILAHELAHVRRHDYMVNLLQTVLETFLFYHPLMWWLSSQVHKERENCCDDMAVTVTGNRVAYGRALLAIENLRGTSSTLALSTHGGSLVARIRRLLVPNAERNSIGAGSLVGIGIVVLLVGMSVWAVAMADSPESEQWGSEVDGLVCRIVAVDPKDTNQSVTEFATPDDVTFAIELKNVSDKPITLLGVRDGDGYGKMKGQWISNDFVPHLFEFEFRDADGKHIRRAERKFTISSQHRLLWSVSTREVKPDQSLKFLLRPTKLKHSMYYRLTDGKYRVKVQYRGPSQEVRERIRKYQPDSPQLKAWSHEVASNEVGFTIAADPNALKPPLVWGPVKDGLQAASEFRVRAGTDGNPHKSPGVLPKTPLEVVFHVKNVSDNRITFATMYWRTMDQAHVTNAVGESIDMGEGLFGGGIKLVRWNLRPGDVADLRVTHSPLNNLVKPGRYTVHYTIRLGNVGEMNEKGEQITPAPGDWKSNLDTGKTTLFLKEVPQEAKPRALAIIDSSGEPIVGARAEFIKYVYETRKYVTVSQDTSNAQGHVEIPSDATIDQEVTKLYVSVQADGYASRDGNYHVTLPRGLTGQWRIGAVNGVLKQPVVLLKSGSVAGRLLGPDKKPFAGARMSLSTDCDYAESWRGRGDPPNRGGDRTSNVFYAFTDEDGQFRLENVPPGKLFLHYPWVAPREDYFRAGKWLPLTWAKSLHIKEGQHVTGVVADLSKSTGVVEGRVVDATNTPVVDAGILFTSKEKAWSGQAVWNGTDVRTDAEGHYRITGLPPMKAAIVAILLNSDRKGISYRTETPVQPRMGQTVTANLRFNWSQTGKKTLASPDDEHEYRWSIAAHPEFRLAHGWLSYDETDGEIAIREHVGGGRSQSLDKPLDFGLVTKVESNRLHLSIKKKWDYQELTVDSKTSYPRNTQLRTEKPDFTGLTTKYQVLWRGDFVSSGAVKKSVVYVARLSPVAEKHDGFGKDDVEDVKEVLRNQVRQKTDEGVGIITPFHFKSLPRKVRDLGEGVSLNLTKATARWTPVASLELIYDAKNEGDYTLELPVADLEFIDGEHHQEQVEVDGQWYEWVSPPFLSMDDLEVYDLKLYSPLAFVPGQSRKDQRVILAGNWRAIPKGKGISKMGGLGMLRYSTPSDKKLVLTPGKHRVRFAIVFLPVNRPPWRNIGRPSRVVSNAVDFEVPAAPWVNFAAADQESQGAATRIVQSLLQLRSKFPELANLGKNMKHEVNGIDDRFHATLNYQHNAAPMNKTKPAGPIIADKPWCRIAISIRPDYGASTQLELTPVEKEIRWDGHTETRGYRVADAPLIITATVQSGSDKLRQAVNRSIDTELTKMLQTLAAAKK